MGEVEFALEEKILKFDGAAMTAFRVGFAHFVGVEEAGGEVGGRYFPRAAEPVADFQVRESELAIAGPEDAYEGAVAEPGGQGGAFGVYPAIAAGLNGFGADAVHGVAATRP